MVYVLMRERKAVQLFQGAGLRLGGERFQSRSQLPWRQIGYLKRRTQPVLADNGRPPLLRNGRKGEQEECENDAEPSYLKSFHNILLLACPGEKKAGTLDILADISATWLSRGDPVGFPSHPRGWFSIVVYLYVVST
jgi:hypothetical protein